MKIDDARKNNVYYDYGNNQEQYMSSDSHIAPFVVSNMY